MDDMERNRTALVTGGVRGIGLAVASALASRRMRVALAYVGSPEDTVQAAVERVDAARPDRKEPLDGRTWAMRADVSDEDQVKAMIEETLHRGDGLDVLVANAGIVKDNLSAFMTADDFRSVLEVNLTGAFLCAREAARVMMRQRSGRIIFMSSVAGLDGNFGQANYAASKAGLVGLAKSLAKELGPRGITVNVVAPGLIETDMTAHLSQELLQQYAARAPLRRLGRAEDVAAAVAFLASDAASFITGQVIRVVGGLCL